MRVFAVDDERRMLEALSKAIAAAVPHAEIHTFRSSAEAIEAHEHNPCNVAFLDIRMPGIDGIQVARHMIERFPKTNIVFVTGHLEYKADAMDVYASDYLQKPVTKEKVIRALANLRHPAHETPTPFRAVTFGNFALYANGKPVTFHRKKSAELLAYLVDRGGTIVTRSELTLALFEDETHSAASRKQLDNAVSTLMRDLKSVGAEDILYRESDGLAVNRKMLSADVFDYLSFGMPPFHGCYMEQYSWGESFKAREA